MRRRTSGDINEAMRNTVIPTYVTRIGILRPKRSHKKPPRIVPIKRPQKMMLTIAPAKSTDSLHLSIKFLAITLSIRSNEPSAM
jgi:hypothetical protein